MSLMDYITKAVRPRYHQTFAGILSIEIRDDLDEVLQPSEHRGPENVSLTGLSVIIEYQDSRGSQAQRSITCRSLYIADSKRYVNAFCHHRQALRSFRLDRVLDVFDPLTGESLSPVLIFFDRFAPNRITKCGLSWGLSVTRRAQLINLLNALVFVARCDKEFHPAKRESLERAITRFWLQFDITADCPADDILRYADRLAPDGETFWLALHRIKEDSVLTQVFR